MALQMEAVSQREVAERKGSMKEWPTSAAAIPSSPISWTYSCRALGDCAAGRENAQSDAQGRGLDAPAAGRSTAKGVDRPEEVSGVGDRLSGNQRAFRLLKQISHGDIYL
jgi:hypothetical protein